MSDNIAVIKLQADIGEASSTVAKFQEIIRDNVKKIEADMADLKASTSGDDLTAGLKKFSSAMKDMNAAAFEQLGINKGFIAQRARDQKEFLLSQEKQEADHAKAMLQRMQEGNALEAKMARENAAAPEREQRESQTRRLKLYEQFQQAVIQEGIKERAAEAKANNEKLKSFQQYCRQEEAEVKAFNDKKLKLYEEFEKAVIQEGIRDRAARAKAEKAAAKESEKILKEEAKAAEKLTESSHISSIAIRESLVLMREFGRGDFNRMAASASILFQSFESGQTIIAKLANSLRGLLNPYTAVAAAAIGLVVAHEKAMASLHEVDNALALTGNMATGSAQGFYKLQHTISEFSHISKNEAREALLEIVKGGIAGTKTTENLAEAAVLLGRKTGQGTSESLQYLMQMKNGAVSAANTIVKDGYNLISESVYAEVVALARSGQEMKAQEILTGELLSSLKNLDDTTTTITKSMRELGNWVSDTSNYFYRMALGAQTATEKLENLKRRKDDLDGKNGIIGTFRSGLLDDNNPAVRKKIDQGLAQGEKDKVTAKIIADNATINKSNIEGAQVLEHYTKTIDHKKEALAGLTKQYTGLNSQHQKYLADIANHPELKGKIHDSTPMTAQQYAEQKRLIEDKFTKKPHKQSHSGAVTEMQLVKQGLQEYLIAHEQAAIDAKKIYTRRLQDTVDFYRGELTEINKSKTAKPRDKQAVKNNLNTAILQRDKELQENLIESMKKVIDNERESYAVRIAMAESYYNKIDNKKSKQGIDASDKVEALKDKQKKENVKLENDILQQKRELELEDIESEIAAAKAKLDNRNISSAEYIKQLKDFIKRKYEILRKELEAEKALVADDPVKKSAIALKETKLGHQEKKENTKAEQEGRTAQNKPWLAAAQSFSQAWSSNFDKVIKRQQSFAAAMKNTFRDMALAELKHTEENFVKIAALKLKDLVFSQFIEKSKSLSKIFAIKSTEATEEESSAKSEAMTLAAASKKIFSNASEAASGAFNAVVGIPIVGPILAPAAGAAAFAAVMAYDVASARGGYDIPSGVNPITQLHEQEMVLPKEQANAVRSMSKSGGRDNNSNVYNISNHWSFPNSNADSFRASKTQIERHQNRQQGYRL